MPKSVLRAVLERMQFTLHAIRRTPHGASHLAQATPAWLVKTRRAPPRHSRDARVYGHTTTAMHKLSTPPPTTTMFLNAAFSSRPNFIFHHCLVAVSPPLSSSSYSRGPAIRRYPYIRRYPDIRRSKSIGATGELYSLGATGELYS